jgi:GT2 family glycosyltransferase
MPEATFIIVNRNTAGLLLDCLKHIYACELDAAPQVILVDNGSTDESVRTVAAAYPEVIIIEAGRNLGFAAANNLAVTRASGEYLILVNTDALLEPDCPRKLIDLLKSDPKIGMAGPQLFNADGSKQTSFEAVPDLATEILNRSLLKRLFPNRYPGKHRTFEAPVPVDAIIGAVMAIRRTDLEEIGGFDERYFFFLEETDLALSMKKAGYKVYHHPAAKAFHLQGATAKTYRSEARIEFYRSRYLFFAKHYGKSSASFLKAVLSLNLGLNVAALALGNAVTLGQVRSLRANLGLKADLFEWHWQGCPAGPGLPRD